MSDTVGVDLEVPIICEACGTTSRVDVEAARSAIERHNEHQHDGDAIATIDPAIKDELASLVARDLELL